MEQVKKITFCYQFGYHNKPFIHGVKNGKDVWLMDNGEWTEDESDERIGLAVNVCFYPGGNWHEDKKVKNKSMNKIYPQD